jgi:PAS domain S-box-containing protein
MGRQCIVPELLSDEILSSAAIGVGVLGLAALAGFAERRFSIANLLLLLGFLGLIGGGIPGVPGSPLDVMTWGPLAMAGSAVVTLLGALALLVSTGGRWREVKLLTASADAKKRDLNRLGAANVRLEDEIQELRGRLTRSELSNEKSKQTGDSARQQRATLARISAREKRHREVFEHAREGMATLEKETLRLAEVNEAMATITGYTKDELGRMSIVDLFLPGDERPGRLDLQRSARDGRPLVIEIMHKDGHGIACELSISVIGDGAGAQLLAAVRDVTRKISLESELEHSVEQVQERERKLEETLFALEERNAEIEEMNRRMIELQEVKDHFLSSVSHELRTPLTSIRSFSEILLQHGDSEPEVRREFLTIINKESERLTRLVNNVLDLAKIEAGQSNLEVSEFDVRDVLNDAIASMSGFSTAQKVGVVKAWGEDPQRVLADRDKVQQLVMNLLANAIKFSPEGSQVAIVLGNGSAAGRIELSVRDRGTGIPPEELERIFEKYHQVGSENGGTGLGLTICHEIAALHGAHIWAESELGRGSVFRVDFPGPDEARSFLSQYQPSGPPAMQDLGPVGAPEDYEPAPYEFPVDEFLGEPISEAISEAMAVASAAGRPITVEAISDMIKEITEDPRMSETGTLPPLGDWWRPRE